MLGFFDGTNDVILKMVELIMNLALVNIFFINQFDIDFGTNMIYLLL